MTPTQKYLEAKRSGMTQTPTTFTTPTHERIEYVEVPKDTNQWHAINFLMMLITTLAVLWLVYRVETKRTADLTNIQKHFDAVSRMEPGTVGRICVGSGAETTCALSRAYLPSEIEQL